MVIYWLTMVKNGMRWYIPSGYVKIAIEHGDL